MKSLKSEMNKNYSNELFKCKIHQSNFEIKILVENMFLHEYNSHFSILHNVELIDILFNEKQLARFSIHMNYFHSLKHINQELAVLIFTS